MVDTIYAKRILEAREMVDQFLQKPIVLNSDKTYKTDRDSVGFPSGIRERNELWNRYLTYLVLNHYTDLLESVNDSARLLKPDTSLERKAREYVGRIQTRSFDRLQKSATQEESFGKFLNSMIHLLDPHSNYFLPISKREFEEDLSGIYYGIGALLQETEGLVKIAELMIGGPAWRSGLVEKGDVLIDVAQENDTAKDVQGFGMSEIIRLTRGKKGTKLTITFRKLDGKLKKVTMVRDALQLDDTFARSAVIGTDQKIGYIFLPKFYTSFDEQNGRSCALDIAAEIGKLQKEDIQGIIIDIRDNGGGSLDEVIRMVGLFIKEGPVVQVKSRGKDPEIAEIRPIDVSYSGPLVVLVNELSASASEIFAAAIQDYKRGVIVGSSSFGKGTVQRGFRVPGPGFVQSETDLGSVHLTLQKYYRVNGDATQLKGITPDIHLPGLYQHYKVQERNYPNALPWDEVRSAAYKTLADSSFILTLRQQSLKRQKTTPAFSSIRHNLERLSATGNEYSLNLSGFREERKLIRETIAKIRTGSLRTDSLTVQNTIGEDAALKNKEQFRRENNQAWLNRLSKDLYLGEAVNVIKDLIKIS